MAPPFSARSSSFCGPHESFYWAGKADLETCAGMCSANATCHCFDHKGGPDADSAGNTKAACRCSGSTRCASTRHLLDKVCIDQRTNSESDIYCFWISSIILQRAADLHRPGDHRAFGRPTDRVGLRVDLHYNSDHLPS